MVPGTKQSINASANKQVTDANSKMASEASKVQGLEEEIAGYQEKIDEANQTMREANEKADSYEELLAAADLYITNPANQSQAADALGEIDAKSLTGAAKDLYDHMMEAISDYVYNDAVNAANTAYTNRNYEEAITQYKKALEAKPGDEWALLYLGHSYYQSGDTANANTAFQELIQKYPARSAEVQPYMTGSTTGNPNGGEQSGDTQGEGQQPEGEGTGGQEPSGEETGSGTGNGGDVDITGGGRLGVVQ